MTADNDALQRHFRELSDDALRRTLDSADLTDAARHAASAEAQARNLDRDASPTHAAAPAVTWSAPPRAASALAAWRDVIGWIYFPILLAAFTYGLFAEAALLRRMAPPPLALLVATTVLDLVACVGYWGWLTRRRIGLRALWFVCALLKSVQVIGAAVLAVAERDLGRSFLLGLVLGLPLALALWHYALAASGPWGARARSDGGRSAP